MLECCFEIGTKALQIILYMKIYYQREKVVAMKKILLINLILSSNLFAAYHNLDCEAFRVSKDSNENIQVFNSSSSSTGEVVNINGIELSEIVSGNLDWLDPGTPLIAEYKSLDGRGNYKIRITTTQTITSVEGRLNIGRTHGVDIYAVNVQVSRNDKNHIYIGTCKNEYLTTCGGECAGEDPRRDEL